MHVHVTQLRKIIDNSDNVFISSEPLSELERKFNLRLPVSERLKSNVMPIQVGDRVIYHASEPGTLGLGRVCIIYVNNNVPNKYDVHVYGIASKGKLVRKEFFPAWSLVSDASKVVYAPNPPSADWMPVMVEIEVTDICEYAFILRNTFKLPSNIVNLFMDGHNGRAFYCVSCSGSHSDDDDIFEYVENDQDYSSFKCMSARIKKATGRLVDLNPSKLDPSEIDNVNKAKRDEPFTFVSFLYIPYSWNSSTRSVMTGLPARSSSFCLL
jgi:hypothetical protein